MMDMNREHHQTPVDRGGTHLCENKMVIIMGGGGRGGENTGPGTRVACACNLFSMFCARNWLWKASDLVLSITLW